MSVQKGILTRRIASSLVDWSIEVAAGIMGSYICMMAAALTVTVNNGTTEVMQKAMMTGLGFGFIFWTLSVSFINRVMIQGVSRASLGKKAFRLELISTTHTLDWASVIKRWLVSFVSLNLGGLGYLYLFFDSEHRTLHDLVAHTDVVPIYEGSSMSVEARSEVSENAENLAYFKRSAPLGNQKIQLQQKLAEVIELRPAAKSAASDASEIARNHAAAGEVASTEVATTDEQSPVEKKKAA